MKIVFFGATDLGHQCLELIIESRLAEVAGIFTIPQEFSISYSPVPIKNMQYADFRKIANAHNIPLIEVQGKMRDYKKQLMDLEPDFLLVIGWYYMIPKSLRELAAKGCAGIHASLLPKYRGGAPLVWAMINGEKETGVSLFYFEDGVDNGNIIAQKKFPITGDDTIREVLAKAADASLSILEEFIPQIAKNVAPSIPQNHAEATHVPQRKPADGCIDWAWDTQRIKNFIRAQTRPYPGAFTIIGGKKITIWDADIIDITQESLNDNNC